ncbi:MAG: DUF3300 domain-containing protein [Oceanipulchritudo sp.]
MKAPKHPLLAALAMGLAATFLPAQNPAGEDEFFTQAELDQMLAPIALYPDVLLSQVLMAATYPLDVVEAARWIGEHPDWTGKQAAEAAEEEIWDDSVKALTRFPDLLERMDENLAWTRRLGEAFLGQEEQVMQTIQELRRKALREGSLESLDHLAVEESPEGIIIEPVEREVIYVPWYSTRVVYGDWWWYRYPPVYWDPPYPHYSSIGFYWGPGFHVSTSFFFSSCDWHRRRVVVWKKDRYPHHHYFDRPDYRRHHVREAPIWRHDPDHRRSTIFHEKRRKPVPEYLQRVPRVAEPRSRKPDPDMRRPPAREPENQRLQPVRRAPMRDEGQKRIAMRRPVDSGAQTRPPTVPEHRPPARPPKPPPPSNPPPGTYSRPDAEGTNHSTVSPSTRKSGQDRSYSQVHTRQRPQLNRSGRDNTWRTRNR